MKRSLSFSVLLSNWIVGFFLFLLFPPEINPSLAEFSKATIQAVEGEISESFQIPENVSFEIEWKLQFFIPLVAFVNLSSNAVKSTHLLLDYNSLSLFDVKKLFIHFFHTW